MNEHTAENDAPLCHAQTYWYENGVQRASWCSKTATMKVRAQGVVSDYCDEHGAMTVEAGATRVTPPEVGDQS